MYQKAVILSNSELIVILWDENLSNMTIKKDGVVIGAFNNSDEVRQGRRFVLPDRTEITVVYTEFGLEVWQNGKELVSGGKSGNVEGFGMAIKGLNWVGGAQLVLAPILYLISLTNNPEEALGVAVSLAFMGGLFIGLGYWASKTGSKIPFWIGFGLCLLNIILTIGSGSGSGIIITGILAYYLYKGIRSESPLSIRKDFSDPNAPLDSNL